ncbi:chromate efflux transporter [Cupriavidus sp. SW-Y-13]|uniref:chromate efflux transporter n=1 Tax=Cupriavidus sp. SW-Y-13 TaxID=2653854 RepID=UPI001365896D|nr:chromate efflux transporter [Cupriavidus sp. SW-Y-13]MWL89318.1 chromate efflux transporter [Cupriavidus sp. SW-Y-13]
MRALLEVFTVFLRLGLTSFGGPVAHLGYFREAFVTRRRWLSESSYADIVALCQFLPGPASSQVGMVIGLSRAGYGGALAAWLGFTLPSAVALILFAMGLSRFGNVIPAGALHGLKLAAVAVVAQAVWGMARSLCPDAPRLTMMALTAIAVLLLPSPWMQVGAMVLAGLIGTRLFHAGAPVSHEPLPIPVGHRTAVVCLLAFAALLVLLPLAAQASAHHALTLFDAFFRAGALVFGGGHVVLPLLQAAVVPPGWVDADTFLAGYGAAQAVPGPLFTFAAFLGAADTRMGGWGGGLLAVVAIFAPSFLLVFGALPFWERLRRNAATRAALAGVNAAVVGLLLAALYDPVWISAVHSAPDFALAVLAVIALTVWRVPPWLVVAGCALGGWALG